MNQAAAVATAEHREKCTKRFVRNARKIAKFLLSQERIVRYTARSALQNAKTRAVKQDFFRLLRIYSVENKGTLLCFFIEASPGFPYY
jgi:hypothetical protein